MNKEDSSVLTTEPTSKYSPIQMDTLKEVINIGGGNAATSLSQLIERPVNMTVPVIEIMEYEDVFEDIMSEETLVKSVMMRMLGDAEGVFLFVVKPEDSKEIVAMMTAELECDEELADSALKELVNIIVNSFFNAIMRMLDVNLLSSIPLLTTDMFGAIVSSMYIQQDQYDENVLIIKNEFYYLGDRLEAALYFVPKPGTLEKLFKSLGV